MSAASSHGSTQRSISLKGLHASCEGVIEPNSIRSQEIFLFKPPYVEPILSQLQSGHTLSLLAWAFGTQTPPRTALALLRGVCTEHSPTAVLPVVESRVRVRGGREGLECEVGILHQPLHYFRAVMFWLNRCALMRWSFYVEVISLWKVPECFPSETISKQGAR